MRDLEKTPCDMVAEVQPEAYRGEIGKHFGEVYDEPEAVFSDWPRQIQGPSENRSLLGSRGELADHLETVKPEALEQGEEV